MERTRILPEMSRRYGVVYPPLCLHEKRKICNPDTQGWRLHFIFFLQTDRNFLMPCRIAQG